MLAGCGTTALAAAYDATLAVNHLLEQLDVFVIDVHRPRAVAIDKDRIFLFGARANSAAFAGTATRAHRTGCHQFLFRCGGERTKRSSEVNQQEPTTRHTGLSGNSPAAEKTQPQSMSSRKLRDKGIWTGICPSASAQPLPYFRNDWARGSVAPGRSDSFGLSGTFASKPFP